MVRVNVKNGLIFSLCWLITTLLWANVDYQLFHADHMEIQKVDENYVTVLTGEVHFRYEQVHFYADHAEIRKDEQQVTLLGNARAQNDSLQARAYQMTYYADIQRLKLVRDAQLEFKNAEQHISFFADQIYYSRSEHKVEAFDRLLGQDHLHHITVYADKGYYNVQEQKGVFENHVVVEYHNEDDSLLVLTTDRIDILQKEQKAAANGHVQIDYQGTQITAEQMLYQMETRRALMVGNPFIRNADNEGRAEQLVFFFDKKNQIRKAQLFQNAEIVSVKEAAVDTARAEKITLWMQNNEIQHVELETQSYARYFFDEEKRTGANITQGDSLRVFFGENQVDSVWVRGNAKGVLIWDEKTQEDTLQQANERKE